MHEAVLLQLLDDAVQRAVSVALVLVEPTADAGLEDDVGPGAEPVRPPRAHLGRVWNTRPRCAAALGFAPFGPVVWKAALPLALGLVVGAAAGPVLARRLPAESLRIAIGSPGLGMAVVLGLDAYD